MMTYRFTLGGQLSVDVESTGFLQTHFYPTNWPPRNPMSNRISQYSGGQVHDHTYGFKVDLDVGGERNTFQTMEYKFGPKTEALNTNSAENRAECNKELGEFNCKDAN